jgi:hypothetical protein
MSDIFPTTFEWIRIFVFYLPSLGVDGRRLLLDLVHRQSRLVYTPIINEMPITYLANSLRLLLSGSCHFNVCDERPKHASRLCVVACWESCALGVLDSAILVGL